jgi:glyoxylase-like metal-dependent hydrolase (beta-lactamase superfamily II)
MTTLSIMRAILLLAVSILQPAALASDRTSFDSWREARAVLARGIEAAGGLESIRRLDAVTLDYDGFRTMINQSRRPLPPWDREPASGRFIVDLQGMRLYVENFTSYPGIGRFGGAWAIKGREGFHFEPDRNHHGSEVMAVLSGADTDGPWAFVPRWIPPLALAEAWDSGTSLRSLGVYRRGARAFDVVTFPQRDGTLLTMHFDRADGRYAGFDSIRADGVLGDVTDSVEYAGWRAIAGVQFPTRRVDRMNGDIARELTLIYTANVPPPEAAFELPAGFTIPESGGLHGVSSSAEGRLRRVADGVYLDTMMGGVMAVEFEDFLVVVECPGNYAMSRSTITALAEAFPDKPVRYVVPSHTHGDHGGGARAYFHDGAILVTTPGNVEFYRRLAQLQQTIAPDPYASAWQEPRIETFSGKHVISDGRQTLELHDLGPNAHSEELTIAYLPRQKVLWQSDLYFTPMTGDPVRAAMPIGIEFARRLQANGLTGFELLVDAHHDRVLSIADFRRSLELAGFRDF